MFLFSFLRPVQSWLLTTKRLLFRESAEVIQYYQGAVESLQEQFQELSRRPQIAKSKVEELFKAKKDLITERFAHFASFHENDPKTKAKVDRYKDEIVGKLQHLETNVMADLNALFNSKTSEIYLSRHGERYRQILQAHQLLDGQTPTNPRVSSTPRAIPPQRPRPEYNFTQPSPIEAPAPEVSGEMLTGITLTVAGLFQNIPRRDNRPPSSPERKEANLVYLTLAKEWRDIDQRFSGAFLDHIGNTPGNIAFVKRAVQHPQQLKDLVQSLYQEYRVRYQVNFQKNIQLFFESLGRVELGAESVQEAHKKLLEELRKDEIREDWDREMEEHPERLNTGGEREVLLGLNKAINNRRLPVKEQLIAVQSMIRFVETNFLNGERLRWESVLSSTIQSEESFGDNADGTSYLRSPRNISLQGNIISVRNVASRTVCTYGREEFHIDLPKLIDTLQRMNQNYPSVFANESVVNLGVLAQQIDGPKLSEFQKKVNQERYGSLIRAFGISERYENFSNSLGNLLNVRDPNLKQSPQIWINQINQLALSNDEHPLLQDKFRFISLLRIYLNTRVINRQNPVTISEFADALLNSGINAPIQSHQNSHIFDEIAERNLIPAVTEIHRFLQLFPTEALDPVTRNGLLLLAEWRSLVTILNNNETSWLTSNYVMTNESSATAKRLFYLNNPPPGPTSYILSNIIEQYHRLKLNNPLFQEIVAIGEKGSSTFTIFEIMNSILGPINVSNN